MPQVDSGKMFIFAPRPTPAAAGSTAKEGGVANASEAFEFLSATFGATLPRGHVSVVPSLPEDACSPLAPVATVAAAEEEEARNRGGGGGDGDNGVGGGGGTDAIPAAVLVKRGGCSFGVKAKNVQVRVWCRYRPGLAVLVVHRYVDWNRSVHRSLFEAEQEKEERGGVMH